MNHDLRAVHRLIALALLAAVTTGCSTTSRPTVPAFTAAFTPPASVTTSRIHLEPLGPRHAQLDYDAFMSSREHLQRTLHWGSWPSADMTVEQNRKDLARHEKEFIAREGYAYTVLRPDRSVCLGCIYINPIDDDPTGAEFAYWVTAAGVEDHVDEHLLGRLTGWFADDWPFETVKLPLHPDNPRGMEIVEANGWARQPRPEDGHVIYLWRYE